MGKPKRSAAEIKERKKKLQQFRDEQNRIFSFYRDKREAIQDSAIPDKWKDHWHLKIIDEELTELVDAHRRLAP